MRLASLHGVLRNLTKAPWPHLRPHRRYIGTSPYYGVSPRTLSEFRNLQLQLYGEPHKLPDEPNPRAKNIVVVGGGITGLTAAFELSRSLPNANIALYESKHKLGGWLGSEIIPVNRGEIIFEWGPRTLRSVSDGSSAATVHLV